MIDQYGVDEYGFTADDYEDGEGRTIVKSGRTVRVPMMARDSSRFVADAPWRFGPAPVRIDDARVRALRAERDAAWLQRQIEDENAWRGSAPEPKTGDAYVISQSAFPGAATVTDSFTLDLDPHSPTFNLAAARRLRDTAYAEAELADANRWRMVK